MKRSNVEAELIAQGFHFGNFDGFVGKRVCKPWQGAFDGYDLICRDVRMLADGTLIVHNPWTNTVEDHIRSVNDIGPYLKAHGKVCEPGPNVWD